MVRRMSKALNILLGCPVYQKPHILREFLISMKRLSTPNIKLSYLFIDDNVNPESSDLLQLFKKEVDRVNIICTEQNDVYLCDDVTHQWNEKLVWKVAHFKNQILEEAKAMEYDYLFLIDSDILLHPKTIEHLVEAGKDIISEVFWTKWQPDSMPQPQVWLMDEYKQWKQDRGEVLSDQETHKRYLEFINTMNTPGIYEVGGLGACTLLSRKAIESGVNFNLISNLSFWGEDRHFCIRAVALGFSLYVDTTYPAYHIYRESDLECAKSYLESTNKNKKPLIRRSVYLPGNKKPTITLSMVVKNEGDRYLQRVLEEHREYIDQAVIIDDGSSDDTIEICRETLKGIPLHLIENKTSKFINEIDLRKQQWEETIKTDPEWILNLDADEIFEKRFKNEVHHLLENTPNDVLCFRLYDFWNETHYREDLYWKSHLTYRPFLFRYNKDMHYKWRETALHCGRFPENLFSVSNETSDLRLKHLGWMKSEDRIRKFHRYLELDPDGRYGLIEQYVSILDENPTLIEWEE
jgi:glycosyltransferase involved in cell wall biosynthesis